MPGYLTVDTDHVRRAWEDAGHAQPDWPEPVLALGEQLDYGRLAVTVHVPQPWPHGVVCRNCHAAYPCRIATWGMHLLQAQDWKLSDVVNLIEARVETGRL
jgi:hypothetical protein